LELVMMGETVFPRTFLLCLLEGPHRVHAAPNDESSDVSEDALAPPLSPREKLILHRLIEGDSNKYIARKYDITEATVKVHVKAILRKIRVHNRTQAAIWGMNNGALTVPPNDSSPSISASSKQSPDPVKVISEIKQVERLSPLGAVNHQANHVELNHG
jgi:DNA-binding CsgD family transcriptional regulator